MSSVGLEPPPAREPPGATSVEAGFGPALAITVTLAAAAVLALMSVLLLAIHSNIPPGSPLFGLINQQNQGVKTAVYLVTFLVILPLALVGAGRLSDRIAAGPSRESLPALASAMVATLAAPLIVVRISGHPGIKALLAAVLAWSALAAAVLWRLLRGGSWRPLAALQGTWPVPAAGAVLLVFGLLLCLTSSSSLGALPLLIGAGTAALILIAYRRARLPHLGRIGWLLDAVVIALVLLAVPDVVIFRNPVGIPATYFDPGLVKFQHDYILGPTNQLLGGGALLAGDPVSQYGVGLIYFVAGWFHIAPIGYGTFGFLDSLLTALFYAAGYGVMRLAGVRRPLAAAAIGLGVVALVYHFGYFVGQLPEEGPLRFGLPMVVLVGAVIGHRVPRVAPAARIVVLCALAVAAVWAFEAFAYTVVTYVALVAVETWLRPAPERRRALLVWLGLGLGAIVAGHLVFALITLAGSGRLPDWGQYLAYGREFLLGGRAGSITYGFATWSPGLAVYGGALVSAAAVVVLMWRRPEAARADGVRLVALAGATAYEIAILSYADNRSSTYLFLYVALPLLIAAALWLSVLLDRGWTVPAGARLGGLAGALAIAVLLLAGAWPTIATHFRRTAMAHFYPNGGLSSALHRLWHPPAIDPRAPEGIRLLDRYVGARRVIILLPTVTDLGTEILIRSHRANLLPIGDPNADGLVPSVFVPRVGAALNRIRAGQRILTNQAALAVVRDLRNPAINPLTTPIDGGSLEIQWILHQLDRRFVIRPIVRTPDGLIVAELVSR